MTQDRRYDEHEVAKIFEAAASPAEPAHGAASGGGMTLAELQSIGREVGLAPEMIAAAATSLEHSRAAVPRRTSLGMPLTAGRVLDLPRPLTDREWALLVVELRAVFGAQGREGSHGDMRQWSNGNLHAAVEPTLDGWRLRLGTLKGDATTVNALGVGGIAVGLVSAMSLGAIAPMIVVFTLGAGALGWNALRLPRWVSLRERQMDFVLERARAITGGD